MGVKVGTQRRGNRFLFAAANNKFHMMVKLLKRGVDINFCGLDSDPALNTEPICYINESSRSCWIKALKWIRWIEIG